jgi:hypothetical protein
MTTQHTPRRWLRALTCLLTVLAAAAVSFTVTSSSAGADTVSQYTVTEDVSGRYSPTAAPSQDYGVPAGGVITVQCQVIGEPVGPKGNDLYFLATYNGQSLYVPDTWTDSPHQAGEPPIAGIPLCGSTPAVGDDGGSTWMPNCDGNAYAAEVKVQDFTDGQFEIKVTPTSNTRYSAWTSGSYMLDAMNEIWHAVQACVSGLEGNLADSIYQQIECHVIGTISGPLHAGGDTFDFESWRGTTDPSNYIPTQCNWGGWAYEPVGEPYRPDRLSNNPTY